MNSTKATNGRRHRLSLGTDLLLTTESIPVRDERYPTELEHRVLTTINSKLVDPTPREEYKANINLSQTSSSELLLRQRVDL